MQTFGLTDIIILGFLAYGAYVGFKRGIVRSIFGFVGIIISIVLAWYLKNPVSEFLYTTLPFFSFKGSTALLNIVIYELIAFCVIALALLAILKLIMIMTGLIDNILAITGVLGIFSKILGLIFGIIESYILVFVVLFILNSFTNFNTFVEQSFIAKNILTSTPALTKLVKNESGALEEIADVKSKYEDDSDEYNQHLLEVFLKYKVIKPDTAEKLVKKDKIKITNAEEIISNAKTN